MHAAYPAHHILLVLLPSNKISLTVLPVHSFLIVSVTSSFLRPFSLAPWTQDTIFFPLGDSF